MRLLWFFLVSLALAACRGPGVTESPPPEPTAALDANPEDCVEDFDPDLDYFPDKAAPQYAEGFSVTYFRHYKVVRLLTPNVDDERTYVLLQCGTPRPPGFDDAAFFEVPARTAVTTTTVELHHFAVLGLADRLVGHAMLNYVTTPEVVQRIKAGEVAEVGLPNTHPFGEFDVDAVAALAPDLLIAPPETMDDEALATLRAAGVALVSPPSYYEVSPLSRAEWVLFTSLFFNREAQAETFFRPMAERYDALAARSRPLRPRPAVFVGGPYEGPWWIPGGESYTARLVADAGGDYLWADQTAPMLRLERDAFLPRLRRADVWLQPGNTTSLAALLAADESFRELPAVRAGRVLQNDAWRAAGAPADVAAGSAYWEVGLARPDQVLADLVSILHPEAVPGHQLAFYRPLAPEGPP